MSRRFRLILVALLLVPMTAVAGRPSLLNMLRRAPVVEADGSKSYELNETDGPWLILAYTFTGAGSKQRAEQLVIEIRRELRIPAFVYRENFDFTGTIRQHAASAKKLRYANQYSYEAYAVLVGEYDTVNHPGVDSDLSKIRTATLPSLDEQNSQSADSTPSNPIELVKAVSKVWRSRNENSLGPMGKAFVTRNPMLPEEYFAPPQVDSFVHQLNDGVPNSLLDCQGKFTVVVKTFAGHGDIVDGKRDNEFEPDGDRLARNAKNAHRMCVALRQQGVEAYQFHDRSRSVVTVGSFDVLGRELPGGQFEYSPEIRRTMRNYGALNVRPELARQVPNGTKGRAANAVVDIPFDVNPKPIAVPQASKRSIYGSALGMR